mgnify:CR=1 FL=1
MKNIKDINMNKIHDVNLLSLFVLVSTLTIQSCSSTGLDIRDDFKKESVTIAPSYLATNSSDSVSSVQQNDVDNAKYDTQTKVKNNFIELEPILRKNEVDFSTKPINQMFSDTKMVMVKVERMPITEYIQYVFGELLEANYIVDSSVYSNKTQIIVNINQEITERKLFDIANQQLNEQKLTVNLVDDVFYISPSKGVNNAQTIVSIGRDKASVPLTSQKILQIAPIKYGLKSGLSQTLKGLVQAEITNDFKQNVLFIEGSRAQVIRTLEFIELLDAPTMRGKAIGLIEFTFITPDNFSKEVQSLLETEGIPVANKAVSGSNVVIIPIRQIGSVVVFASSEDLLQRVKYWANILDKPSKGEDFQFYNFKPKFARALDIGTSIQKLLTSSGSFSSNKGLQTSESTGSAPANGRSVGATDNGLKMVVDDRTNSLIFYTTGQKYQSIIPLLKELDILPKQIFLDITIAEVSLKDEFKFGVEFALEKGNLDISTLGAFGGSSLGGIGALYEGTKGAITANMLNTSSLVKVLSKPTILVRDGMTSSINIGSEVSVVGATTSNLLTGTTAQTTTTEYRSTGVDVTVTPTVNADDVVIMQINQSISNTIPDSNGAGGNPDIFKRQLSTEVIAKSGQTVLLAGLISENANASNSGAPGLSKIPLIGNLFESKGDTTNRTELVMLITPRVLTNLEQSDEIKEKIKNSINYLSF